MKEYAGKRWNARQSLIVIGNTVLLRQSRAVTLTPAYDSSPYSVTGVNELWSRLKEWERSKPGTHHISKYLDMQGRRSMTCWTGIKTALVTPKKRREPSWIISGNPLKYPPPSLPEMEVVGDSHQTVDHTQLGLIRSTRDRNSTCNTLYWDFVLN